MTAKHPWSIWQELFDQGVLPPILRPGLRSRSAWYVPALQVHVPLFSRTLDSHARAAGVRGWLEKTPRHLHYLPLIERYVPGAHVVHIVRDGMAVISSMVEATTRHPEKWGGVRTPEECFERWSKDVEISLASRDLPNHTIVSYEDLVTDTTSVLQVLCRRLSLDGGTSTIDEMVRHYGAAAARVTMADEPWKSRTGESIGNRNTESALRLPEEVRNKLQPGVDRIMEMLQMSGSR